MLLERLLDELKASMPAVSKSVTRNYRVRITSPVLARDVYVSFGAVDATVSDNYIDILPGESVDIDVASNASLDKFKAQLKIVSLADAFAAPAQPATVSAAH